MLYEQFSKQGKVTTETGLLAIAHAASLVDFSVLQNREDDLNRQRKKSNEKPNEKTLDR